MRPAVKEPFSPAPQQNSFPMHLKSLLLLVSVTALASLPSSASAQSVSLQLLSYSSAYQVHGKVDNGITSREADVFATLQHLSAISWTPAQAGDPATLDLFCVELGQLAPLSATSYTLLPLASADSAPNDTFETIAGVGAAGIGGLRAQNLSLLYGYEFSSGYTPLSLSALNQAAFQLAVWKLSHDDNFNHVDVLAGSYFSASNNAALISATNALLDGVVANAGNFSAMSLNVLHSDTGQDYILPTLVYTPIPEPSTYAAILGALVLGVVTFRRRQSGVA